MAKTWQEVRDEINEAYKKYSLEAPEEIVKVFKYDMIETKAGSFGTALTTQVFAAGEVRYLSTYAANRTVALATLRGDEEISLQALKAAYRIFVPMSAEFSAYCGLHEVWYWDKEVQSVFDQITTREAFVELVSAYFDPDWFSKLSRRETDFMLSHEAMHIILGDIDRPLLFKGERYHLACDIIANSFLRESGWYDEKLGHIGTVYHETFFPTCEGRALAVMEAFKGVPFDPSTMPEAKRRNYMIDSDLWWDRKYDSGESGEVVLTPGYDSVDPDEREGARRSSVRIESEPEIAPNIQYGKRDDDSEDVIGIRPMEADTIGDIIEILREEKKRDNFHGDMPSYEDRLLGSSHASKLNWRELLDCFMQEEVCSSVFK